MIYLLKALLIAIALTYASFQDIKTREIDDRVWLLVIPLGAILTAIEIFTTPGYPLLLSGLSIILSVILALALFYAGLYGGADAKALIAIAATLPLPPYTQFISPFYPLAVFGNALDPIPAVNSYLSYMEPCVGIDQEAPLCRHKSHNTPEACCPIYRNKSETGYGKVCAFQPDGTGLQWQG